MILSRSLRIRPSHTSLCLPVRTAQPPPECHAARHEVARTTWPVARRPRLAGLGARALSTGSNTAASADTEPTQGREPEPTTEEKEAASMAGKKESVEPELDTYKATRLAKLKPLIEADNPVLKHKYPRLRHKTWTMTVKDFVHLYKDYDTTQPAPSKVTLYGRIRSIRRHGIYLIFLDVVNQFETIQAIFNWAKVRDKITKAQFKLFARFLDIGDHISITGLATRSSTGQLTIEAIEVPELLSPAFEPIPNRLIDPETKVQRRHLDLLVNREASDTLRMRSSIISHLRQYLDGRQFLEVQTPILEHVAGGANARPFVTTSSEVTDKELSLRIAPELWLKRLVVGGVHRVFEIGPAFRNESIDSTHNPEFTMCEYYAAFTNLGDLVRDTENLISSLAKHCHEVASTTLTSLPPIDPSVFEPPYQYIEFIPALEKAMGVKLPDLAREDSLADLMVCLELSNIKVVGSMPTTLPKLLDRLSAMYLEPMTFERPTFILHHPACMSPLSKSYLCPKTKQSVSARAELFIQGREIANMYEEENDPDEQLRKMREYAESTYRRERAEPCPVDDNVIDVHDTLCLQREYRKQGMRRPEWNKFNAPCPGYGPKSIDRSYIRALHAGLPPTGGWGCGIERLVMLFTGASRISDCIAFGSLRHVANMNAKEYMPPLPKIEETGRAKVDALTKTLTHRKSRPKT